MLLGMELIASILGGATIWILGLGLLIAWFLVAAGRFWSRLAWAYFLVKMRRKEQMTDTYQQINHNYQNEPLGAHYAPVNQLTPTADRQHYWKL
jgi:hypothetical protein